MLLDTHYFACRPTLAQFAKSNAWESAWSFSPCALPTRSELNTYLDQAPDVAFEVFFGPCFLGIKLPDIASPTALARCCIDALDEAMNAAEFVNSVRRYCALDLPFKRIVSAAIGATNAWLSVGPYRLTTQQLSDVGLFWSDLARAPVASNSTHPKVMEAVFAGETDHWLALPVSVMAPPYEISPTALHEASCWFSSFANTQPE